MPSLPYSSPPRLSGSSHPLHVLHVSHAVNTGLAHCVADYVSYQLSHGLTVSVACPGGRLGALAATAGARVLPWTADRNPGRHVIGEARQLRQIIARVQPDVVHLHCAKAGLVGRLLIRGRTPTVFSPHAWSFLAVDGLMQRVVREWERFAARWTTATVCVSQGEATTGRRQGIRGRCAVLPNEVQLDGIEELVSRYRAEVRAELGVSAGQPLAVCAARLCRQKGQDVAIGAWARVREVIPNAELVLIGHGDAQAQLEAVAGPGVRFAGPLARADTLRWMYAADAVLCPSRWEGMSLVPLEAMALGRPVVASDVDGMREVIPAEAGWLLPPENVGALATTVISAFADPGKAFDAGQRARAHVLTRQAAASDGSSSNERLITIYTEISRLPPQRAK